MPEKKSNTIIPEVIDALYISSTTELKGCPEPSLPEYAFIGRSNVGKSSLINMITGRRHLAKTSSTPGKTRLINHFLVDGSWYIADLPGYGYAKVSKSEREKWPATIRNYLIKRRNLLNTFILVDSRLEPQASDLAFMRWMGQHSLPFSIVCTKCDKLSAAKIESALKKYKEVLAEDWEELPTMILTSSVTATGRFDILKLIQDTNRIF